MTYGADAITTLILQMDNLKYRKFCSLLSVIKLISEQNPNFNVEDTEATFWIISLTLWITPVVTIHTSP